jgi:hypothetical protein
MKEPAPYPITIQGHEEIKQPSSPDSILTHSSAAKKPFEPNMDGTDRA